MITSSNGSIFCVTGHWCREFIPAQRPVTWSFDVFFDLHLNKRLSKQPWLGDLRRHLTHYDVTIMVHQTLDSCMLNIGKGCVQKGAGWKKDCFFKEPSKLHELLDQSCVLWMVIQSQWIKRLLFIFKRPIVKKQLHNNELAMMLIFSGITSLWCNSHKISFTIISPWTKIDFYFCWTSSYGNFLFKHTVLQLDHNNNLETLY